MIYAYEIVKDMGYDGFDVETIYSHEKFSDEEFQQIVEDAMKVTSDIKEEILETHDEFFDLEVIASARILW